MKALHPRVHIPKATAAKARQKAEELEELLAKLEDLQDFPEAERTREASARRRREAQADFEFFARTYLPELIEGAGCVLHGAIARTAQALVEGRPVDPVDPGPFGELVEPSQAAEGSDLVGSALAAPRGHAKSTWGNIALSAWAMLTGRKAYIQDVMDTYDQAEVMVEAVRMLLEDSPRIRADFGELVLKAAKGTLLLQVPLGPDGEKPRHRWARMQAYGSGQKLRGRLHQGKRPDLVLCDDVENDEAVENKDRRKKLRRWFLKAVLPALDPKRGALLMLGTVLHDDALLWSVLRMFGGAVWRCWDEDETPLWPERFSQKHLRQLRAWMDAEDPGSFAQEMENRAQGDDEKPFKKFESYTELPERLEVVTHVDPATGKAKGDFTALVTVGFHKGVCYVLDAVIKRLTPTETGKAILAVREAYPGPIQCEEVAYQTALDDVVSLLGQIEGVFVSIKLVPVKGDKTDRIKSMEAAVNTGRILFPSLSPVAKGNLDIEPMVNGGASGIRRLQEQLLAFPKGKNDDGPDALQGATGKRFRRRPFGGVALGASMRSGVIA